MVQIPYTLTRKAVKNINLRVRPDGSVLVSAPPRVSLQRIDAFVQSKSQWILTAQQTYAQATPNLTTYATGATYFLLGQPLTIHLCQGTPEGVVQLQNTLLLTVKNTEDEARTHRLVTQFEKQRCQEIFTPVAQQIQQQMSAHGIPMPQIRFRAMTSRWGSCLCNKNTITLNTKLLACPLPAIEYVILHEFCHFIHPNHSRDFYNFLSSFMPDWKERRRLLTAPHL